MHAAPGTPFDPAAPIARSEPPKEVYRIRQSDARFPRAAAELPQAMLSSGGRPPTERRASLAPSFSRFQAPSHAQRIPNMGRKSGDARAASTPPAIGLPVGCMRRRLGSIRKASTLSVSSCKTLSSDSFWCPSCRGGLSWWLALGGGSVGTTFRIGRSKVAPSFWMVVEDHQAKVFTVFGPLVGDAQWTQRVERAREQGRNLTLCTVRSEVDARVMMRDLAARGFARSEYAIL